jgi:RHS repeat-associated protein
LPNTLPAQGYCSDWCFTTYKRDGNDYAMARDCVFRLGRFLTPDPAGNSATCPFNPQTQNRYAYVTDNPVNRTDPTGLCGDGDNSDCGGIGISLPIFPGGGGSEAPAPPTPHPIFSELNPLLALSEKKWDPFHPCGKNPECIQCSHDCGLDAALAVAACTLLAESGPGYLACVGVALAINDHCQERCRKEYPPY